MAYLDVVVDIETLSTKPNALILSIGAIYRVDGKLYSFFEIFDKDHYKEWKDAFDISFDSLAFWNRQNGVNDYTKFLDWNKRRNKLFECIRSDEENALDEKYADVFESTPGGIQNESLESIGKAFIAFIKQSQKIAKEEGLEWRIWGKSPEFDLGILENFLRALGIVDDDDDFHALWTFWQKRDVRTVEEGIGEVLFEVEENDELMTLFEKNNMTTHCSIYDAYTELLMVEHWRQKTR